MPEKKRDIALTQDERGCIQRALWVRRDNLQAELLYTESLIMNTPSMAVQATEAARIIRYESDMISKCLRALWIVYGDPTNGNYEDAPLDPRRR